MVQLLVEVVVGGIQPPLTQVQFAPGCTVVQPPVLPPVPPVPVPVLVVVIEPCATNCAMTFVKAFDAAARNFAVAPAATAGCVDSVVPELVSCACGPALPVSANLDAPHLGVLLTLEHRQVGVAVRVIGDAETVAATLRRERLAAPFSGARLLSASHPCSIHGLVAPQAMTRYWFVVELYAISG